MKTSRVLNQRGYIVSERPARGLTLLELVVVMAVLVVLAGIVVPTLTTTTNDAHKNVTLASMRRLQDVIVNRYQVDMRGLLGTPGNGPLSDGMPVDPAAPTQVQLVWLFTKPATMQAFDAVSHLGWNGPYLTPSGATYPGANATTAESRGFTSVYGVPTDSTHTGDQTVLDGWGNPIVIRYDITSTTVPIPMLVSAGADGTLDAMPRIDSTTDVVLRLQ